MTAERLFDALPFSKPRRNYKDEKVRTVKPAPEIHRVELGTVWRLTRALDKRGAEVHAFHDWADTSLIAVCDAVRVPLTFTPGTPAAACLECWKRGAR